MKLCEAIKEFDKILSKYRDVEEPKRAGYSFFISINNYIAIGLKEYKGFPVGFDSSLADNHIRFTQL